MDSSVSQAASSDPFWERVAVAATGPLVTVVIGGLVVWGITYLIQQSRENSIRQRAEDRADADTSRELRARDDALRHELVTMMTESAATLYLVTQHYWRAKVDQERLPGEQATEKAIRYLRARLDAQYLKSRASGEALEFQLLGYFVSARPRDQWHQVQDLLTVRYFQLIDRDTDKLYEDNVGPDHSGLDIKQLRNAKTLLNKYKEVMREVIDSVFKEPLAARSSDETQPAKRPVTI
ncbi:hypothetical protein AB0E63_07670 [Kribbella sp. NPDC026596]|uniref:hypothetical protein n=1 Tax=Kribbella sp. NPDC026596 TaxID=3155122 RepID=UPI0033E5B356